LNLASGHFRFPDKFGSYRLCLNELLQLRVLVLQNEDVGVGVYVRANHRKFGDPERRYANKKVCVTGLNKDYEGVPELVAEQPSQIEIQK